RINHRGRSQWPSDLQDGDFRNRASCRTSFGWQITVQLAEQGIAVFLGPVTEMGNEVLDLLAGSLTQSFDSAKIRGITLHQIRVELMLADDLAETVAHLGSAIIPVSRLRGLFRLRGEVSRFGKRSYFLHRADTDAIGLAQGSVNSACFGNTHFGTVD